MLCNDSTLSEDDAKANPKYDAATANWGKKWRLPTDEEMREIEKCNWRWEEVENSAGEKIAGYTVRCYNKNSIFFPAGGYYSNDTLIHKGTEGRYWSITPNAECKICATNTYFTEPQHNTGSFYNRFRGLNLRAVLVEN